MSVSMADKQAVLLTANESDADGQSVPVVNALSWAADSDAVVTLAPSDDTFTCTATAVAPGTAMITVTDTVLNLVSDPFEIDVAAGAPATITITAGDPQDQAPSE